MSIAAIPPPGAALPTHLDLPHTDDKPVENAYQPLQSSLLSGSLVPWLDRLHPDGNYYIGADNGIYWRLTQIPEEGCRAPDWFYVESVPRLLNGEIRRSYVMWQERVPPLIIIEYVSGNGDEERDRTPGSGKYWVYEQAIQARYYAIWDSQRTQLEVFERIRDRYQLMSANSRGHFPILPMELELGIWEGAYQGCPAHWLRAWDTHGRLLPTPEEWGQAEHERAEKERKRAEQGQKRAEQERKRAEQEQKRAEQEQKRAERERKRAEKERKKAEQERQRADALAAKLRELGLDPDRI